MAKNIKNELFLERKQEKKKLSKNWKLYASALGIIVIGTGTGLGIYYGVNTHNTSTKGISNQDIVNEINQASYTKTIAIKTTVNDLKTMITSTFIQEQLIGKIKENFKSSSFNLNSIITNNKELTNNDLLNNKIINAEINYNYDGITNQKTKLTINVMINETQIIEEINQANYSTTTTINSQANDITNLITNEFILAELSNDANERFNSKVFNVNKITINGNNLTDHDLTEAKTINAKINYNYGEFTNQETNLTINIIVSDKQINDAINQANYSTTTIINSQANDITNLITSDFIKQKLIGEITKAFNAKSFNFNKITIDDHNLNDNDLLTPKTINAKINYNYGEFTNQETNLTINIMVSDKQINDAINQASYQISILTNSTSQSVNNQITGDFIPKQLPDTKKTSFNAELFKFNKITINGNNLTDHDLTNAKTINAKINYNYGEFTNQETNLTINILPTEQQIVDTINAVQYTISTTSQKPFLVSDIIAKITPEFMINQYLIPTEIRNAFQSDIFKLNLPLTTDYKNGNREELTNDDLIRGNGWMTIYINYDYGSLKNQTTHLDYLYIIN